MSRKTLIYILLVCSIILLVINIIIGYVNKHYNFWNIVTNILLLVYFALTLRQIKSKS